MIKKELYHFQYLLIKKQDQVNFKFILNKYKNK
jgi:hypothetical protein